MGGPGILHLTQIHSRAKGRCTAVRRPFAFVTGRYAVEFPQSVEESEYIQLIRGLLPEQQQDVDEAMRSLRDQFAGFMSEYEYGLREVMTKVSILRDEYEREDGHGPIEHVKTRLKSPDSILKKLVVRGYPMSMAGVRQNIRDIAGVRITCPYATDVYLVASALADQPDLTVLQSKDYIHAPKPNGYRSLHLIVSVPVFLSSRTVDVPVEIQIRTIAMDFWASVEHQLRYKYDGIVPEAHSRTLEEIAATAKDLDDQVAALRAEVQHPPVSAGFPTSYQPGAPWTVPADRAAGEGIS